MTAGDITCSSGNCISGTEIDESTLGTVPSATSAAGAGSATSSPFILGPGSCGNNIFWSQPGSCVTVFSSQGTMTIQSGSDNNDAQIVLDADANNVGTIGSPVRIDHLTEVTSTINVLCVDSGGNIFQDTDGTNDCA